MVLGRTEALQDWKHCSGFQRAWPWPGDPCTSVLCQGQEDSSRGGTRTALVAAPPRGPSARRAAGCVAITIPTNASASSKLVFTLPSFTPPGVCPPLFRGPPGHSLIKRLFPKQAKLWECHFKPPLLLEAEEPLYLPSMVAEGCNSRLSGHPQPKLAWGLPAMQPGWQKGFPTPFALRLAIVAGIPLWVGHLRGGAGNLKSHARPPRSWASATEQRWGLLWQSPAQSYTTKSLRSFTKLQYFCTSVLV